MPVVKTSAKCQVVIPAELREKIGLKPGDRVLVTLANNNQVIIQPIPEDPIEAACGMLEGDTSLAEALIKERRDDRKRHETKLTGCLRDARLPQQRKGVRKG